MAGESDRKPRRIAFFFTGLLSGFFDSGFHWLDTASKRFQAHGGIPRSYAEKKRVLWPHAKSSLWRGYWTALLQKLSLRSAMFGSKPFFDSLIEQTVGSKIDTYLPNQLKKPAKELLAGTGMGLLSLALLPVDNIKIRRQLGIGKKDPITSIIRQQGIRMFDGAAITAIRDVTNLSLLLGVNALVKSTVFDHNSDKSIVTQNATASFIASVIAIIFTNVPDCIKTRIQTLEIKPTVADAFKILTKEGPGFWRKGLIPRLAQYGPRLWFSMFALNMAPTVIDSWLDKIARRQRR